MNGITKLSKVALRINNKIMESCHQIREGPNLSTRGRFVMWRHDKPKYKCILNMLENQIVVEFRKKNLDALKFRFVLWLWFWTKNREMWNTQEFGFHTITWQISFDALIFCIKIWTLPHSLISSSRLLNGL